MSKDANLPKRTCGALDGLRTLLETLRPGPVPADRQEVLGLLRAAWSSLAGGGAEGMHAGKLGEDRVEDLRWDPPILGFRIERHGGTVCGSTRAEMQGWSVDVERGTASSARAGHRQIHAMEPRYTARDVERDVERVAGLLAAGKEDECLRWNRDQRRVRVILRHIVPQSFQQTTRGRNRRFMAKLVEALRGMGWTEAGLNAFEPPGPADAEGDPKAG